MNTRSGTFRTPLEGDYFFIFSGMKDFDQSSISVILRKNGKDVASSFAQGIQRFNHALPGIQVLLNLNVGNEIYMFKTEGRLSDDGLGYADFTGWLVEQHF